MQTDGVTVSLRAMGMGDLAAVARWLSQSHVREWWRGGDASDDAVRDEYAPAIAGEAPTALFVIEHQRRAVGMMQCYRIADYPPWAATLRVACDASNAAGIDYLIGEPDAVGLGIGTAAITQFVPIVFARWPEVDAIVVAMQQGNPASWRALEHAGFRRVWQGCLDSDDPSDTGPGYVYELERPRVVET